MAYFFFKLLPPRPSFTQDMTQAERELMERHAAYWQALLNKGSVLVFGPVFDPKGPYGAGIATFALLKFNVETSNERQIFRALMCLYLATSLFWILGAFWPEWQSAALIW